MFEKIIGLSRSGCACLPLPSSQSDSGYYVDDTTDPRIPLNAAIFDCSDPDAVTFLNNLIPDAVREMREKIDLESMTYRTPTSHEVKFNVPIKISYMAPLAVKNYSVLSIRAKAPDQVIEFLKMDVLQYSGIDYTGDILVIQDDEIIHEGAKSTFVGKEFRLTSDLHLVHTGTASKDMKFKCCGKVYACANLIDFGSGGFGNLDEIVFKETDSESYTEGFVFEARVRCDSYMWMEDINFKTHPWGNTFARGVQLVARKNLAKWIISSGKITTYLTMMEDNLDNIIISLEGEIAWRAKFLAEKNNYSSCYYCSSGVAMLTT